ncbi:hypothetical protein Trydic_g11968 [Trypoxylus dichotomus]
MLSHDFQARYGYPPDIIPLNDIEKGPGPDNELEIVEQDYPIITHVVEHKQTQNRAYDDDSSDDEAGPSSIVIPVMDRINYCRFMHMHPRAVVIETSLTNVSEDGIDDN